MFWDKSDGALKFQGAGKIALGYDRADGVTTFSSITNFNQGINVTGHSELDNVNIAGVSTWTLVYTILIKSRVGFIGAATTGGIRLTGVSTLKYSH